MLPAQSHVATKGLAATRRENFEISVRDKSDATAKRGFRVQVPKRMLTYTVLIFIVAPLFLFGYMEVHNRAHHHHHPQGDSKGHEHFPTDILSSLLTDSQEEDAVNSTAADTKEASLDAGNTTSIGDKATTNSTLEQGSKDSATDAHTANQAKSDEQPTHEKDIVDDDQADTQKGERRVLRQSRRQSLISINDRQNV
jgi:hypothetical protein